jgi:hypothetical protein
MCDECCDEFVMNVVMNVVATSQWLKQNAKFADGGGMQSLSAL